uniref:Uncharacterized protein n=1 Tax=Romanomermis culicivorax TaxID=13658 RepID=A0A915JBR7_ROMCU
MREYVFFAFRNVLSKVRGILQFILIDIFVELVTNASEKEETNKIDDYGVKRNIKGQKTYSTDYHGFRSLLEALECQTS